MPIGLKLAELFALRGGANASHDAACLLRFFVGLASTNYLAYGLDPEVATAYYTSQGTPSKAQQTRGAPPPPAIKRRFPPGAPGETKESDERRIDGPRDHSRSTCVGNGLGPCSQRETAKNDQIRDGKRPNRRGSPKPKPPPNPVTGTPCRPRP